MLTLWHQLLSAVGLLGGALLPLAAVHALPVLLESRGWLALVRLLQPPRAPSARYLWRAALIREAIASCLPLSGVGIFAVALRLLALRGVPAANAVAGLTAESTLMLLTQTSFVLVTMGARLCATSLGPDLRAAGTGLATLSVLLVAAVLVLHRYSPIPSLLERLLRRVGGLHQVHFKLGALDAVYRGLDRIYAHRQVCLVVALWQLAALAARAGELWLMLNFLHVPQPLLLALSLSTVARLTRSAAAALPAGLGLQELAFGGLLLGFGFDFTAGVAISIATRARDLLFGIPALLGWLQLERSQNPRSTRGSSVGRSSPMAQASDTNAAPPER